VSQTLDKMDNDTDTSNGPGLTEDDVTEDQVTSDFRGETRLNFAPTTVKAGRSSGDTHVDEGVGAYRVQGRAFGALPVWTRIALHHQSRREQQQGSGNDDLPPEMRPVGTVPELQERVPPNFDDGMIATADIRYAGTSYHHENSKSVFGRSRKFWIITGVLVLLVAVGIAVGVVIALLSGDSSGGDPCDFSNTKQPNVFAQCECNQEITVLSDSAIARYEDLLNGIVLEVNPDFSEPVSSCEPENLALAWLATDEYSSSTSEVVTLTNRYVLAVLFQSWTGTDWNTNTGWLSPSSECEWFGITCEGTGVVGLELGDNSLRSSTSENGLPVELFALTSLRKSVLCDIA